MAYLLRTYARRSNPGRIDTLSIFKTASHLICLPPPPFCFIYLLITPYVRYPTSFQPSPPHQLMNGHIPPFAISEAATAGGCWSQTRAGKIPPWPRSSLQSRSTFAFLAITSPPSPGNQRNLPRRAKINNHIRNHRAAWMRVLAGSFEVPGNSRLAKHHSDRGDRIVATSLIMMRNPNLSRLNGCECLST